MNSRLEARVSEAERQYVSPVGRLEEGEAVEEDLFPFERLGQGAVGFRRAWWQEKINGPHGVWKTAAFAVALTYTLNAVSMPVATLAIFLIGQIVGGMGGPANLQPYNAPFWMEILYAVIYALPCIATGALLARIAPRNAVRGAALGIVLQLVLAALNLAAFGILYHSPNVVNWMMGVVREAAQAIVLLVATWLFVRRLRLDR